MDNKIGLTFIHKNRLLFFTNSAALRGVGSKQPVTEVTGFLVVVPVHFYWPTSGPSSGLVGPVGPVLSLQNGTVSLPTYSRER